METALPKVYPSVVHMLVEAAARAPEREALVQGTERLSYAEYLRCVAGFAAELESMGARGQRVVLIMNNSIEICVAMFAAHLAHAQVAPLNPLYTDVELEPMLADAQALVVVYDAALAARVEPLADAAGIAHRIRVDAEGERVLLRWRADAGVRAPAALPDGEVLATLQFTGGTTGRSKGANLTHAGLAVNISQREALVPTRKDVERMLCVMPLFHCYAVHVCLHTMAYARGTLVILPRYHPQELLQTMVRERITMFGGSPTLFTGLMNYSGFETTDFSSLHVTYSGSAALPEELLHKWERATGAPVVEGYGQSESGPVISFNPLAGPRKSGSVGIALPRTEVQIVDLERGTKVLPAGYKGEIRMRGPQIMLGYRNRPEETQAALRNAYLYTGDIGELDGEGYLYIRGRKKEMIIVSGYNVFPREIEETLYLHPGVSEAAVVGRADAYRGELPIAFVVARSDADLSVSDIEAHCEQRLAVYKRPVEIRLVPELPKTSVGKIDKLRLSADLSRERSN